MKRALIVEDNPTWTDILRQYCQKAGLESSLAGSPQQAMDSLDQQIPDLIILDMLLAAETGMALLNEMRGYSDLASVPIIICSSIDFSDIDELAQYGVVAIINKSSMTPAGAVGLIRQVAYGQQ